MGRWNAKMRTMSGWTRTRRGARIGAGTATTMRGITTAVTTARRVAALMKRRAMIMAMSSVGIEEEHSVPPWMLMAIRRSEGCGNQPVLLHLRRTLASSLVASVL